MRFKKVLCGMVSLVMAGVMLCPMTAMAAPATEAVLEPEVTAEQFAAMTPEELAQLEHVSGEKNGQIMTRATGLINSIGLDAYRVSGGTIGVSASTGCIPEVSKSGFTQLTLQRRPTGSNSSWTTYNGWGSRYSESSYFETQLTCGVPSGYEYRVYGVHYAYRSLFNTQSIENATGVLAF